MKKSVLFMFSVCAVFTAVGIAVSMAQPADAGPTNRCPRGAICFYRDYDFASSISIQWMLVDARYGSHYSIGDFRKRRYVNERWGSLDNSVSSISNNSNRDLWVCLDPGYKAGCYKVNAHSDVPRVPHNDVYSSARTFPRGTS